MSTGNPGHPPFSIRPDKWGHIPAQLRPILERLGLDGVLWLKQVALFRRQGIRVGKGIWDTHLFDSKAIKQVIPFEGNEKDFETILKRLNR